jgi:lipoyl(octanoyl) transferase
VIVQDLGRIDYDAAHHVQLQRRADVEAGAEETLFLLEHEPVVTVGRSGRAKGLMVSEEFLVANGVALRKTERGGDVTCHFPGQLVAYVIFRLAKRPGGVRSFVQLLEQCAMDVCAAFGVRTHRRDGFPGVWTETGKIASIGLGVRRWVSYHGLALNVGADLGPFEWIVPCGVASARATSLDFERRHVAEASGRAYPEPIPMETAKHAFVQAFRKNQAAAPVAAGEAAQG